MDEKNKPKIATYLANFLTPSAVGFLKNTPKIADIGSKIPGLDKIAGSANPWGALGFGILDIVSEFSDDVKNSYLTRFAKFAGAVFYGGQTIADIISIGQGNYTSFVDLVFDGSMAYSLGMDTVINYSKKQNGKKRDLLKDVPGVRSLYKDKKQ